MKSRQSEGTLFPEKLAGAYTCRFGDLYSPVEQRSRSLPAHNFRVRIKSGLQVRARDGEIEGRGIL